jgi:hypothetical protein
MTDLLDDLRAADPIAGGAAEPSPELRARALRRPARRRRVVPVAVTAVAGLAVALLLLADGTREGPDLAARAYAATGGSGVIHWRVDDAILVSGHAPTQYSHVDGWSSRGVTHVVFYDGGHLETDIRTAGGRYREWDRVLGEYSHGAVPTDERGLHETLNQFHDPIAALRTAYRAHKLVRLSATRYSVGVEHLSLVYELDPRTGVPQRLIVRYPTAPSLRRTIDLMRFAVYQRLSATAANRAKLALLPHPSAGPSSASAVAHFAVLRHGPPLSSATMAKLRRVVSNMASFRLDVGAARRIARNTWLVPGRGFICIASASGGPSGSMGIGCNTIPHVIRDGYGVGGPAAGALRRGRTDDRSGHTIVVVPDGVTALRLRQRGHPHGVVRVHDNAAELTGFGYTWTPIRHPV